MPVRLEVVHGDVLQYDADVLALKFAQHLYGVDAKVVGRLAKNGIGVDGRLPAIGDSLLVKSDNAVAAREILFVGVEPLGRFDYETIRMFACSALSILWRARPTVGHVAMTLHGTGFGLDEDEAFRAEIAGVLDAVHSGEQPCGTLRVSIVERDGDAASRLKTILNDIVPFDMSGENRSLRQGDSPTLGEARAQLGSVGHDSRGKPHVFVAMPFADEYTDRFHYGIKGAANAAGFLCERADLASFTGDVIAWVKDRIGSAALVVADLTAANPNVYLEVGYAWGRGVNTVLLVADGDELEFDVRTQRCLVFRSIRHLEELLTIELKSLVVGVGTRSGRTGFPRVVDDRAEGSPGLGLSRPLATAQELSGSSSIGKVGPSSRETPIDYTKICFVVMPFGSKLVGKHKVNFDNIYEKIFKPAINAVGVPEGGRLKAARTDKDFFSGDIGQEMFQYLNRSRFVLADITSLNPNVMYEIGVRHAARVSGTAIFRQGDATIPFDINHIKAFPYLYRPERNADEARKLIRRVLRESLQQNALDSPVQIALKAQSEQPRRAEIDAFLLEAENALRQFDRPATIAKLRQALAVSGGNALIHVRLGILLRDQGDLQGAIDQFRAATTLQPDYSDAWRERGIQEARASKNALGEEALRKAIALNPSDFDALASLGGILRKTNRLEEAAQCYQNAVGVSGGHPYPLLMALKLRARTAHALSLDNTTKRQLFLAEKMRTGQASANPPFDVPWCLFDTAEMRLYAGDAAGFIEWTKKGLNACQHNWEPATYRSALQLLIDGGVQLPGLSDGLPLIDAAIKTLP